MKLEDIAATPLSGINLREPVRVAPSTTLLDVVRQMRDHLRGAAIVEDDAGMLLGIFTERDLMLRVDHSSHEWHRVAVSELMSAQPVTAAATESLADALECMRDGGFRHLPVIDSRGHATGLLSVRDVLAHIVEYFPEEFINLPPNPESEASGRWGG